MAYEMKASEMKKTEAQRIRRKWILPADDTVKNAKERGIMFIEDLSAEDIRSDAREFFGLSKEEAEEMTASDFFWEYIEKRIETQRITKENAFDVGSRIDADESKRWAKEHREVVLTDNYDFLVGLTVAQAIKSIRISQEKNYAVMKDEEEEENGVQTRKADSEQEAGHA